MKKDTYKTYQKSKNNSGTFITLFICLLFSLNAIGQKVHTTLTETWENGNWQNYYLQTNTYGGSGYLTNDLSQIWAVPTSSWVNDSQSNYINNPDGTVNQITTQSWDTASSAWKNIQRLTFTYTAANKPLTTVIELWTGTNWQNSFKQTNAYDGSNYLINSLSQNWNLGSSLWENSNQINYNNFPNGNVNQATVQSWNPGTSTWNNSLRNIFTYNASNYVLTTLIENWNGGTSTWNNFLRSTNTYNASNKVLTSVTEMWQGVSWVNYTQQINTYSGANLTNSLSQNWDIPSSSWKNSAQSNYTNNPDGTVFQIVNQLWDLALSIWNNSERITFTYTALGINDFVNEKKFILYPNPSEDRITIKTNYDMFGLAYSVVDQIGRPVLSGTLNNEETAIDVYPLNAGIYFVRIGEYKAQTIKIIKK